MPLFNYARVFTRALSESFFRRIPEEILDVRIRFKLVDKLNSEQLMFSQLFLLNARCVMHRG